MRITIMPVVEIAVDNSNIEECGDCKFMPNPPLCNIFCLNISSSKKKGTSEWVLNRCQACLDAEKEVNDAN